MRKIERKDSSSSTGSESNSARRGIRKRRVASEVNCVDGGGIPASIQFNAAFKEMDHGNEKKSVVQDNVNRMRDKVKEISGEEALRLYNLNWPNHNPITGAYQSHKHQQLIGGIKSRTQSSSLLLRRPETSAEHNVVPSFGSSDSR